jgi:choline dehydrogenase-like flavoprotein
MALNGFGEMLPNPQNRCTLDPTVVGAWGIPALHIDCAWGPNELAIHRDMNVTAAEMLEKAGARNIQPSRRISTPGNTNHEMGTARMGRDPKTSVLNGWNQPGTCRTCSSPTAGAWPRRGARTRRSPTWR